MARASPLHLRCGRAGIAERRARQFDWRGGLARAHRRQQRFGLGGGLRLEVRCEPLGEVLVGFHRARAIAEAVEQRDQPAQRLLVVRAMSHRPAGPLCRGRQIALGLAPLDQRLRAAGGSLLQPSPLALLPVLELPRVRDEEALQQVTPVEVEGLAELFRRDGAVEGDDIAPHQVEIERDLLIPTGHDHVGAQGVPHHVERLAQCRARMLLVELGPEQGEQAITAVEAPRSGGGEVGKQGEAPRSGEKALHLASRSVDQMQSPEQPELNHARSLSATRPLLSPRAVTVRSQRDDAPD